MNELKPNYLNNGDLLFVQRDICDNIYFIHEGKIKIFADLHEYITDPELEAKAKEFENLIINIQMNQEMDKPSQYDFQKPNITSIVLLMTGG